VRHVLSSRLSGSATPSINVLINAGQVKEGEDIGQLSDPDNSLYFFEIARNVTVFPLQGKKDMECSFGKGKVDFAAILMFRSESCELVEVRNGGFRDIHSADRFCGL
jgi:hypothetical protein